MFARVRRVSPPATVRHPFGVRGCANADTHERGSRRSTPCASAPSRAARRRCTRRSPKFEDGRDLCPSPPAPLPEVTFSQDTADRDGERGGAFLRSQGRGERGGALPQVRTGRETKRGRFRGPVQRIRLPCLSSGVPLRADREERRSGCTADAPLPSLPRWQPIPWPRRSAC